MSDPFSLTALMSYASVASAAVGAVGAIQAGNAQEANFKAQQNAAEFNATIARNNAKAASDQANTAEEAQRRKAEAEHARAVAAIGQSGTGYDGSNLDLLKQGDANGELDALNVRYQGQMNYGSLMLQSQLDTQAAKQAGMNADAASTAGWIGAGTSLLSGASKYVKNNKASLYPGGYGAPVA